MTCDHSTERISALVDSTLSGEQQIEIETRLKSCEDRRQVLADLRRIRER